MSFTPWASTADIKGKTGKTVDGATRTIAVGIIESVTGLIEEVEREDITDRDRYWLKLAVCYEAAFVVDNPDLFSRADVTSASQDGESVAFRNVDSHLLGPLARKAIRRLSWRGIRALAPGGGSSSAPASRLNVNSEEYDDSLPWVPM